MAWPVVVRLRFHASSPDGRQSMPTTIEVPVQSAGMAVAFVAASSPATVNAYWVFAGDVTTDGIPDPAMKVGGVGPVTASQAAPRVVQCTYPGTVNGGDSWSIDAALTHVVSIPLAAFPQHGLVIPPV